MAPPTTLIPHPPPHRSSRWVSRSLLLAVALLAAGTQAACVSLAGSKTCPSYSTLSVDTSIVSKLKDYGIVMAPFKTAQEFDQAAANATGFFTASDSCKAYTGAQRIPYQNTVLCTIAVLEPASVKCPGAPDTASKELCASSCSLYLGGLTSLMNQSCANDTATQSNLKTLTEVCSTKAPEQWPGLQSVTNATCVNALQNEAATCGLASLTDKCTYCKTNATAECCKDAATQCPQPTLSTGPTGAQPSTSPTGVIGGGGGGDGAKNPSDNSGISSTAVKGIIGGAVGLVVIAAALFIFMRRAKRKPAAHKGNGLSRQVSNSSGRYNISSPKIQEEGFAAASTAPIPMTTLPSVTQEPMSFGALGGAALGGAAVAATGAAAAEGKEATGKQSYCQALYPYQASMADELDLTPGDIVNVQRVFDDGWAVGVNMNTSNEGAFPVVCVMFVDESALDDDFEDVNMHSMTPMTLREEDQGQGGRNSPSGRNSPRSSLPSRSSSPVHLPRRNSSIRDSTVILPGTAASSSPLGPGRVTPQPGRDTMMSDASSINRWWDGEKAK
ncbi:hypothetical protein BGZ75_003530 [Mortierella antarctica]|nr:hypothetical protein BGZ75_003530 [Mortierella antarctica]